MLGPVPGSEESRLYTPPSGWNMVGSVYDPNTSSVRQVYVRQGSSISTLGEAIDYLNEFKRATVEVPIQASTFKGSSGAVGGTVVPPGVEVIQKGEETYQRGTTSQPLPNTKLVITNPLTGQTQVRGENVFGSDLTLSPTQEIKPNVATSLATGLASIGQPEWGQVAFGAVTQLRQSIESPFAGLGRTADVLVEKVSVPLRLQYKPNFFENWAKQKEGSPGLDWLAPPNVTWDAYTPEPGETDWIRVGSSSMEFAGTLVVGKLFSESLSYVNKQTESLNIAKNIKAENYPISISGVDVRPVISDSATLSLTKTTPTNLFVFDTETGIFFTRTGVPTGLSYSQVLNFPNYLSFNFAIQEQTGITTLTGQRISGEPFKFTTFTDIEAVKTPNTLGGLLGYKTTSTTTLAQAGSTKLQTPFDFTPITSESETVGTIQRMSKSTNILLSSVKVQPKTFQPLSGLTTNEVETFKNVLAASVPTFTELQVKAQLPQLPIYSGITKFETASLFGEREAAFYPESLKITQVTQQKPLTGISSTSLTEKGGVFELNIPKLESPKLVTKLEIPGIDILPSSFTEPPISKEVAGSGLLSFGKEYTIDVGVKFQTLPKDIYNPEERISLATGFASFENIPVPVQGVLITPSKFKLKPVSVEDLKFTSQPLSNKELKDLYNINLGSRPVKWKNTPWQFEKVTIPSMDTNIKGASIGGVKTSQQPSIKEVSTTNLAELQSLSIGGLGQAFEKVAVTGIKSVGGEILSTGEKVGALSGINSISRLMSQAKAQTLAQSLTQTKAQTLTQPLAQIKVQSFAQALSQVRTRTLTQTLTQPLAQTTTSIITPVNITPFAPISGGGIRIPPIIPPIIQTGKETLKDSYFDVFVKNDATRNATNIKANKLPLTRENAINLGAKIVDNTASAQFTIKPVNTKTTTRIQNYNQTITPHPLTNFRNYKIEQGQQRTLKNTWIEKQNQRINTPGEIQGITAKGWLARQKTLGRGLLF